LTRSEYIRLLENPYATIDVADEQDSMQQLLFVSQNPYATHYYSEDRVEIVARGEGENPKEDQGSIKKEEFVLESDGAEQRRLSAAEFESECRAIFRMYRPLGQRSCEASIGNS